MGAFILILFVIGFFVFAHAISPQGIGMGWFLMAGIVLAIIGFNSPGENG
jgi:hypothetical protein